MGHHNWTVLVNGGINCWVNMCDWEEVVCYIDGRVIQMLDNTSGRILETFSSRLQVHVAVIELEALVAILSLWALKCI